VGQNKSKPRESPNAFKDESAYIRESAFKICFYQKQKLQGARVSHAQDECSACFFLVCTPFFEKFL
jgi:hypothetical protein